MQIRLVVTQCHRLCEKIREKIIFSKKSKASGIECCESENKLSYKEKFTKVPNFIS